MKWQDYLTAKEKTLIAKYDRLRAEYRDMQPVRNRIRNRARQEMLKRKNIT